MKRALAAATLVLALGGLSACGSDDDSDSSSSASESTSTSASAGTSDEAAPSEDTSESSDPAASSDFCSAFETFVTDLSSLDQSAGDAEVVKALKAATDKLSKVELPSDIPDDAKAGFEKTIDAIESLPDDASAEDIQNVQNDFTDEEKANSEAFNAYLSEQCPEFGGSSASSAPESSPATVAPSAPTDSPS
jgi:hypothetical protein